MEHSSQYQGNDSVRIHEPNDELQDSCSVLTVNGLVGNRKKEKYPSSVIRVPSLNARALHKKGDRRKSKIK